jgi:hypothetical protein
VTNGFRSDWARDLFASVRSIVNTGKRHGLNTFKLFQKLLPLTPQISYSGRVEQLQKNNGC